MIGADAILAGPASPAGASIFADFSEFELGSRRAALIQSIDFGTRGWAGIEGEERIDPLFRLFDPDFQELTWSHDHCHVIEQPGKLHAKQLAALTNLAVHRWLLWGNQVGKTTLGAVDMCLQALGRHPLQATGYLPPPPFHGWASALSWELWENTLLPELLSWIPAWRIIDAPRPRKKGMKREIVLLADNGTESRITGKAAEQGAQLYQSARVNLIWLDEEHPEDVWDEMQPRLLRFGGRTLATMTPLLGMTWVHGRVYEPLTTGKIEDIPRITATRERIIVPRHWYSHAGLTDNPAITPEAIATITEELKHNPSQLASRLHGMYVRPEGAVLPWDAEKHLVVPTPERMHLLNVRGAWYGALDLGKWRFAFSFGVADSDGYFMLVDEYFSQNQSSDIRAEGMTALMKLWRVPDTIMIPADCADPAGIRELNESFERINSPYRVYSIDGTFKDRKAGILRLENLLNRGAWKVRRGMGGAMQWRLRAGAAGPGRPVMGSRWIWEIVNWLYPKAADGKVQKEEPDDFSADGADMMDTARYIAMAFFPADALPTEKKHLTERERHAKWVREQEEKEDRWIAEQDDPNTGRRFGARLRQ